MSDECYHPPKPQPSRVKCENYMAVCGTGANYFTCYVISFPGGKLWMFHIYLVVYLPL